ncbi:pentapeptide repeat-containing protein [Geminocystis sp. GBBB08]|uniref:pentapeptide repeat-containing protein n=1 Tax=Geminocystis sp. GBBB08 TaxID=2604140 RepID=UPI0029275DA3|nr:hypothetical protein [Geminocystis sp. GBBB08]
MSSYGRGANLCGVDFGEASLEKTNFREAHGDRNIFKYPCKINCIEAMGLNRLLP